MQSMILSISPGNSSYFIHYFLYQIEFKAIDWHIFRFEITV